MYDGQKIIETRNGSGTTVQQFIHGTQYIDELVMVRVKDKGDLYVHQDANWNVIGMTDLGRHLVERDVYSPYGELTVHQSTGYGDRDGDGDVDSTDKGTVGTTCTGTVSASCRILDLDFDGDYDASDATKFDSLQQGLQRTPGRLASTVQQPFAHQGLLFEPEIRSYQNRARQYDAAKRRFVQRDPAYYRDSLNLYVRLSANPYLFYDPTGAYLVIENPFDRGIFGDLLEQICPGCGITIGPDGKVIPTATPTDEDEADILIMLENQQIRVRLIWDPEYVLGGDTDISYPGGWFITMGPGIPFLTGPSCPSEAPCVPRTDDATLLHELWHVQFPYPGLPWPYDRNRPVDKENDYRGKRGQPLRDGCDHRPKHPCCPY